MNICVGREQTGSSCKGGARNPRVSINPLSAWVRNEQKESKKSIGGWLVQTLTVLIRSAIENSLCYMADLPKVVIACCAKVSFIHSNNALLFCHNTALYVFSEINYLCLCLCLLHPFVQCCVHRGKQLHGHTCTETVPLQHPLYTPAQLKPIQSQIRIILGSFIAQQLRTWSQQQLELRELRSSDVLVVLEQEVHIVVPEIQRFSFFKWFQNKRFNLIVVPEIQKCSLGKWFWNKRFNLLSGSGNIEVQSWQVVLE